MLSYEDHVARLLAFLDLCLILAENVFSSLVGLQFLWKLVPKSSEGDNSHYLVHVPLKETPLSDCGGFCGDLHTQIELEDRVCLS